MKRKGRGGGDKKKKKKKLSLIRKSESLEPKWKIQDVFVLPLTTNPLVSAAGLGVCYGAAFIEVVMPSRALLPVLSEKNATWVTSFQLRQRIINVCTSALPGGCLSFCFPLYIERTVFLCVFPKMTKQNQRRSLLVFPLPLSLSPSRLARKTHGIRDGCLSCSHNVPFC